MLKKASYVLGLIIVSGAQGVSAEISGHVTVGYDDNAFNLRDVLNNDEGAFGDVELRWRQDLGAGFSADIRGNLLVYGNTDLDADQSKYSAALKYDWDSELFGQPGEHHLRVRLSGSDKTFISRSTGQIGSFAGQEIGGRFNSDAYEARGRTDLQLNDTTSLRLQLDGRMRNYDDFSQIGLSILDYSQAAGSATLRFRPSKSHDTRVGASIGQRWYDDRRGRDLAGNILTNTDLNYSFYELGASWKYSFAERQDLRFSYDMKSRDDSVRGYYDTTSNTFGVRYRYKLAQGSRLVLKAAYSDLQYDNISFASIIENEEDVGPKDGTNLSAEYEHRLFDDGSRSVSLVSEIASENFDSPNADYIYDQTVARIGISFEF